MDSACSDFPEHGEILDYLKNYANEFGLDPAISRGRRVLEVAKTSGGEWRVVTEGETGDRRDDRFDAVCVCTGPHRKPRFDSRDDPLYSRFRGRVMYAGDYKCSGDVAPGETVLVVGAGESAADLVAECAQHGAKVFWASRHGQWFADRNIGPYPADHFTAVGLRAWLGRCLFVEHLVRRFVIAPFIHLAWGRGGHGIQEWYPSAPYLHQFINKSRDGIREVYRGRVHARRAPCRIQGRQVWFQGNPRPAEVSLIILATGYEPCWPFLEPQPRALYRLVFEVDDPSLAFVGYVRPVLGSIPSLSELQARWLAGVWSGRIDLPCRGRRRVEAWIERRHQRRRMLDSSERGVLVDQEVYATQIAARCGAALGWFRLLLRDPRAFRAALWSPWTAFKYRLLDPDPKIRQRACHNIQAEMPARQQPGYGGHPVYLLVRGLLAGSVLAITVAAGILWMLPLWAAMAVLAGFLTVVGFLLQWTARPEKPPAQDAAGVGAVRRHRRVRLRPVAEPRHRRAARL